MSAVEESTAELSPDIADSLDLEAPAYIRPITIDRLTDTASVYRWINATSKLSDDDYEAATHDLGWRAALWYMRYGALTGQINLTKACDIYLKRFDAWRESHGDRRPRPSAEDAKPFLRASE
jgi:hypothetical protein